MYLCKYTKYYSSYQFQLKMKNENRGKTFYSLDTEATKNYNNNTVQSNWIFLLKFVYNLKKREN